MLEAVAVALPATLRVGAAGGAGRLVDVTGRIAGGLALSSQAILSSATLRRK
jgi:hypothetical protein